METAVVIADTGFVVALLNQTDIRHTSVTTIYNQQRVIVLSQTVLAEVAYLVGCDAGISVVVAFLRGIAASRFNLIALTDQDITRTAQILDEYKDSRIDFVDASVMALAERFSSKTVLTLDQRDFRLFRPQHCDSFNLLP